jgi:hypothetical protein
MVEMRLDQAAAAHRAVAAAHDQIVALDRMGDAGCRQSRRDRGKTIRFLDAQFLQAAHPRLAMRKSRRHRQDRIFVDHRRGAGGGHVHAFQRAGAHSEIGDILATFQTPVEHFDLGPHFQEGRQQPGAQGVHHHARDRDVRARRDQRGDHRKGRRGRIGGHDDRIGPQLGAPFQRDPSPGVALHGDFDLGAEVTQHFLRVVARGFRFDHACGAVRVEAGEQHRRFDLRRGDRRPIDDRRRLARPAQDDRAAPALGLGKNLRPHQRQRIENAPHRAFAQRRIAVERRRDGMAAHHAHHQARSGAGVAEVERMLRRQQRADSHPRDAPVAFADARDLRAERLAGLAGAHHVVAFEQPFDFGNALAKQAEDKGAVRYRFVARGPHRAFERAAAAGGKRRGRCADVRRHVLAHNSREIPVLRRFADAGLVTSDAPHVDKRCEAH